MGSYSVDPSPRKNRFLVSNVIADELEALIKHVKLSKPRNANDQELGYIRMSGFVNSSSTCDLVNYFQHSYNPSIIVVNAISNTMDNSWRSIFEHVEERHEESADE
jgi:hypothetical protein